MFGNILPQLAFIVPELLLALSGVFLLLVGVFSSNNAYKIVNYCAITILFLVIVIVLKTHHTGYVFGNAIKLDLFNRFLKILILLSAVFSLMLAYEYNKFEMLDKFELPILYLFASFGMLLMVSASNMLSLYFGLEIQSLSLYALAAFDRSNIKSSEAGMKYFILGALSSGMLLYGISIIYGYTGQLGYAEIAQSLKLGTYNIGPVFGLIFILCALAFKISATPFHMWTPDVYEGAPTPITSFFATSSKIAAIGLLTNLVLQVFPSFSTLTGAMPACKQIILILAVLSMFFGAFAAIGQTNIKRLMAYSSISHVGYILLAIFSANKSAIIGLLIYLSVYLVTMIGIFAFILSIRNEGSSNEQIYDISGLAKTNPLLATFMTIYLVSLAGVPPLAGFFAKWYVIISSIEIGYVGLAIAAVVAAAISSFYYLRIIKIIWFDEVRNNFSNPAGTLKFTLSITSLLLVFYILFAGWLYKEAYIAASSFM